MDDDVYFPHDVVGYQLEGGSLIAAWRKYKKLSQEQLADRIGVSQSAVAQMEKIDSKPKLQTLERVAQALGIQIAQLNDDRKHYFRRMQALDLAVNCIKSLSSCALP